MLSPPEHELLAQQVEGAPEEPRAGGSRSRGLVVRGSVRLLLFAFLALSTLAVLLQRLSGHGPVAHRDGSSSSSDGARGLSRSGGAFLALADTGPNYTVIVDCGSSHTTLHVYEVRNGIVKEVEPGKDDGSYPPEFGPLTDFVGDSAGLAGNLTRLINESLQFVPEQRRSQTPLYIYATAGMRLLPASVQRTVFDQAADAVKATGAYSFDDSHVRSISEEMEAVFAYLAVNQEGCQGRATCNDTVGVMEMGGASMQVAFAPEDDVLNEDWTFDVGPNRRTVYAKGYMRFGQNEALSKSISELAARHSNLSAVVHPCFLHGYSGDMNVSMLTEDTKVPVHLVGGGDAAACDELVTSMLHLDYECDMPPCTIRGAYMPRPSGLFVALSGFSYAVQNFDLPLVGTTPGALRRKAEEFCAREASDLTGPKAKYLDKACFLGWYAYRVLRALGFGENYADLDFSRQAVWPVGAVLYETVFPNAGAMRRRLMGLGPPRAEEAMP